MTRFSLTTPLRAVLLGALLSTASFVPAAMAESVSVMVLNTRGEDGIYRPALRIIRNGTVTFVSPADTPSLTNEILKNEGALNEWLDANIAPSQEGGEVTITIEEPPENESDDCQEYWDDIGSYNPMFGDMAYIVPVQSIEYPPIHVFPRQQFRPCFDKRVFVGIS